MRNLLLVVVLLACESGSGVVPQDTHSSDIADVDTGGTICPQLDSKALGVIEFDDNGLSNEVSFEVPQDAISFLVSVNGELGSYYTTASLIAPDGSQWVEPEWYSSAEQLLCISCKNRVASERSGYALMVPIAPHLAIQPGTWRLRLFAFDGTVPPKGVQGSATAELHIKRASDVPSSGRLKLRVHLSGENGTMASNALEDSELQTAIETLKELLSQADLTIDSVSYSDVPDVFQTLNEADYESLISHSQAGADELSLFLVGQFTTQDGQLRGLTTVPGPWGAPTLRSGIVVSTASQVGDTVGTLGRVMAHELGHYLGLFHVTETGLGKIHDPISDTQPFSTTNLMSTQLSGGEITVEQGKVLRLHPAVSHPCSE